MDVWQSLALMGAMSLMAALPSSSVALVVTRSATAGVRSGVATAAGIVLGDLVFLGLAILGLSMIAETLGPLFAMLRILGGVYLVWLGVGLVRARGALELDVDTSPLSLARSVAAGFMLTLGDVKAILFYASLLPTVIDLEALGVGDALTIGFVTALSVGGVKITYALLARRIIDRIQSARVARGLQLAAGGTMVGAGTYLITTS